jgi:hypothetical protein
VKTNTSFAMKFHAFLLAALLVASPLLAAEWPAAFARYEALALEKPGRGVAMWQMWKYAVGTMRVDELKQRWEAKAAGEAGRPHRLLLAFLAEFESDYDTARAHFDKAIESAPNDAAVWLARGQMEAGRRMPEARATLEKAVELEMAQGGAGAAAEALAEEHLAAGRVDETRAVLDRAVAAAREPESWMCLTQKRAEAALAQGRLGELIAQLEAAPPRPMGGSEIAQAYFAAQDFAQASAELARARKARPQDALLRRQALAVARAANRTSEIARLLREETKLASTPEVWREFFRALLANDAADEARAVLAAQSAALFAEPRIWRDQLPELWQLELALPMAEALARPASEGNWDAALLRAELLIAEKMWEPAEEALWSILDPKCDAQPLAAGAQTWAHVRLPFLHSAAMPGAHLMERTRRLTEYLNRTPVPFNPKLTTTTEWSAPIETLHDARDLAVLYLAMIAAERQRAPAFVAQLAPRIAAWARAERLLAWAIVQNPAGTLSGMVGDAGEPRDRALDGFCRVQLANIRALRLEPELAESAAAIADKLAEPMAPDPNAVRPSRDYGQKFRESNRAFSEGRFDEAWKIFAETAAAFRASGSAVAERETMACAMSFAFLLPEIRGGAAQKAEGAILALRSAFPPHRSPRWPTSSEGMQALFPTEAPALHYRFFERGTGEPLRVDQLSEAQRGKLVYPPRSLFTWEQTGVLWTVFGRVRDTAAIWQNFVKRLDAQAAELPRDEAFFARAATAWLAWWNNEGADAIARMQKLLAETGDPSIRVGLAAMLRQQSDSAAAGNALAELTPPTPAYARTIKSWRLRLMTETRDAAAAATLARELADAPWEMAELRALLPVLEKAGCTEAVAVLRPRLQAEALREEDAAQLPAALRDLESPATRVDALAMAKRILAPAPSAGRSTQLTAARAAALQTLKNLGEREAYLAQLTRESAASPEKIEPWLRLAEASSEADAVAAWRKVIALQPDHRPAARELLKAAPPNSEERRQMFEKLLAVEPDEVLAQRSDFLFSEYEKAGQLPRLAEVLAKAPFREGAGWRTGTANSYAWRNRAQRFISVRQPEAALVLLRKAVATVDPVPSDLRRMLLQQLVALNRREEAGREIVECLAPAAPAPPLLFAWRSASSDTAPTRTTVDVPLLKMAQSLGVTPELRARVEQAAARDATARAFLIFLRVANREPEVLPDIVTLSSQLKPRSADTTWILPLATELADWPEAREACQKLLAAYDRVMEQTPPYTMTQRLEVARVLALAGGKEAAVPQARAALEAARKSLAVTENRQALRVVGEIALAAGDAALLAECSRAFVELIEGQSIDTTEPFKFAGRLLEANHVAEAQAILGALRKNPSVKNNSSLVSKLNAFEMDAELRRGNWRLATPIVWLDADRTTPESATLVWELGFLNRSSGSAPQPMIGGGPLQSLEKRFTVELFFGEDAESMQPLARLPEAGARGVWQGRLPAAAGFIRAVFSEGDGVLFGEAFAVWAVRNLLREGDAGKPAASLPTGEAQVVKGGPAIEGEYVSVRPTEPISGSTRSLAVGPRVKVQPGCDYVLAGWLRVIGNRSARLGWRALDRDGKSVGNGLLSLYASGERFWTRATMRLSWPRNDAEGDRVPPGTAFLEPVVEGDSAFDLAGLSLVEIPLKPPASEP